MQTRSRSPLGPEIIGIVLVVVGALFLVRNAGLIDLDWGIIWPIAVIAVGAVVIFGAMRSRSVPATTDTGRRWVARTEGADALDLELRVGAGRFIVGAGTSRDELVAVESTDDDIDARIRREGRTARVRLVRDVRWWPFGPWDGQFEWRIGVARETPVRLDVAGGAGDFAIDLADVMVTRAKVSIGAAQLRVRLPRPRGDVPIEVATGASAVVIEVPSGVEARVRTSGLLAVDGRTETPGYGTSPDRVSVRVEGGAASVRVREV
jgi:hypothetical protein